MSKVGIEPTTSEVTGACSDDCAAWLLMCRIKQFYSNSLNSLALACVSLQFFIQQLPNSFLGRTAKYKDNVHKILGMLSEVQFPPKYQHFARMYDAILIRKPFGILLLSYLLKRYSSNQKV